MKTKTNHRKIKTSDGVFVVPRHINRIENKPTGNQGWQVRFDRKDEPYFSRLFSNGVWGGAERALNESIICLEEEQDGRLYTEQLMVPGIDSYYVYWIQNHKNPDIEELRANIHLCRFKDIRYSSSYFVCTNNNYTRAKEENAHRICQDVKEWACDLIKREGREAVVDLEETPDPHRLKILRTYY